MDFTIKNSCYSKFVSKILNIEYSDSIQIFTSLPNAEREITILSVAEENEMAVYHLKQQINRYPDDLDSKIRILELYYIPDVYAERRDYLKYAEEILEKDSNNPVALGFVTTESRTKGTKNTDVSKAIMAENA